MSYGQGGPQSQWDPWKPHSQQDSWNGAGDDGTPDWAALAEASETRNKRRRLLFIGGGVVVAAGVGTAVALGVVSADGPKGGAGAPNAGASLPSATAAAPSFAPTTAPPPLDPKEFISSARKDTAPLSPETLFPGTRLTVGGTVYAKGATADSKDCSQGAGGTLPQVLKADGCTRLMRVTYSKDGIAVTVGVAVFQDEAAAAKAKGAADKKSIVRSLPGKGVKSFCDSAICRSTTNAYGRYAYFTITGFTDGKNVTTKDTPVFRTGDDLAEFTFRQIRARGEAQASAAAANG
ncbi:hypothetical protein KUM39_19955 [Streptomyces sp. J2-1]|uniref:hypothetical protein n=1 Tax=Streptomyces corallincola TaxID=2851888 RepID=UPI001C3811F1|nr:hypothetical protein [Streptomyces corallincola]MBV2356623.1 hypothetical protein [Streptomyces corallincola]